MVFGLLVLRPLECAGVSCKPRGLKTAATAARGFRENGQADGDTCGAGSVGGGGGIRSQRDLARGWTDAGRCERKRKESDRRPGGGGERKKRVVFLCWGWFVNPPSILEPSFAR